MSTDLNFKNNDPGAVKYGNFINYYQFHPPKERLSLIPTNLWNSNQELFCLDIGCNSGDLTISLQNHLENAVRNCEILGIDIDPILIERCKQKDSNLKIEFHCMNFMENGDYLKDYLAKRCLTKFSVIFCFSITMWIHLNNGDDGLRQFLRDISSLGEMLVIEPQPWKCYKTALKRFRRGQCDFPHFKQLKIRQNVEEEIEIYLKNLGLNKIHESEPNEWQRRLMFFQPSSHCTV